MRYLTLLFCYGPWLLQPASAQDDAVWPANDSRIQRTGGWEWTSHRYAADKALVTSNDGARLELPYQGCALVLCLDTLTPVNYGSPQLGRIEVFVDGAKTRTV